MVCNLKLLYEVKKSNVKQFSMVVTGMGDYICAICICIVISMRFWGFHIDLCSAASLTLQPQYGRRNDPAGHFLFKTPLEDSHRFSEASLPNMLLYTCMW
jgi:hypothetical protein